MPTAWPPGISRGTYISTVRWTDGELAILARAERLRGYGMPATAQDVVARGCVIPQRVQLNDYVLAVQLDLRRWYAALLGSAWDGSAVTMARARERANRLRRNPSARSSGEATRARGLYRTSHLLVESLDDHPAAEELADITMCVGWPTALNVGRLQWDNPNGLACIFCKALLLPCEAENVPGAPSVVRGKSCCRCGCVEWTCIVARRARPSARRVVTSLCRGCLSCSRSLPVEHAGQSILRCRQSSRHGCGSCGWVTRAKVMENSV